MQTMTDKKRTASSYTVGPHEYQPTFLPSGSIGTNGVLLLVRELYTLSFGSRACTSSLGAGGARHSGCAICDECVERLLGVEYVRTDMDSRLIPAKAFLTPLGRNTDAEMVERIRHLRKMLRMKCKMVYEDKAHSSNTVTPDYSNMRRRLRPIKLQALAAAAGMTARACRSADQKLPGCFLHANECTGRP